MLIANTELKPVLGKSAVGVSRKCRLINIKYSGEHSISMAY